MKLYDVDIFDVFLTVEVELIWTEDRLDNTDVTIVEGTVLDLVRTKAAVLFVIENKESSVVGMTGRLWFPCRSGVSVAVVGKEGVIEVTLIVGRKEATVEFLVLTSDEISIIVLERVVVVEGDIMLKGLRDGIETGVDVKSYVADMFNTFPIVELV